MLITLPIKTISKLNQPKHYMDRSKRARMERGTACMMVRSALWPEAMTYAKRFVVTLTRVSSGKLDAHDNLPASLKNIVDGIADALQVDDGGDRVTWKYSQEKCKRGQFGVRINIEAA